MSSQSAIHNGGWSNVNVPENALLLAANKAASTNERGENQTGFAQGGLQYNSGGAGQSLPAGYQKMAFQNTNQQYWNPPQYNLSAAALNSSTPGSVGSQNMAKNYAQPSNSNNFNGPIRGQFSIPGSAGVAFNSEQGEHFVSQTIFGVGGQFEPIPRASPCGEDGNHPMMIGLQQMERTDQGLRRHTSYVSYTEHRIFELNKRLQQRNEESDNCWWDSFATEFFDDNAKFNIVFCQEDGPIRYLIGRTLIPRFFKSIFEGGVTDFYFRLKHAKESFHNASITLHSEDCTVITQHGKPFFTKVCADARLVLEFVNDDNMRIKTWHMTIKGYRELIPRSVIGTTLTPDAMVSQQVTKNITRGGITNSTLNYLRMCVILAPMQELMIRYKAYGVGPRDCMKSMVSYKWQTMVAAAKKKATPRPQKKPSKRKGLKSGGGNKASTPAVTNQKRLPPAPSFFLSPQDLMTHGGPTMMKR